MKKKNRKNTNSGAILWVLTVVFLCYSLSMFKFSFPAGLLSLLFTASLCPLTWKLISQKVNLKKPAKIAVSVVTFLMAAMVTPETTTPVPEPTFVAETGAPETVNTTEVLASAETSPQNIETVAAPKGNILKVHFIDVGQGDSILIQSGEDHDMLIDAGENDQGDTVVTYLQGLGIDKLDYVIGTHPHSDHIGGLDDVINNFEIGKILLPPVEHTTKTYEDVLSAISSQGLKITKPVVGDSYTLGETTFKIIAPNDDYGDDLNNWSIGIKIINGENSFVMCGDAEALAEADILKNGIDISTDVLKLGHHGSKTSTSGAFLEKVNPEYAVISCGLGNSYGHPTEETLNKLRYNGVKVFRTDEQGTIIATSDGTDISWSTQPSTSNKAGVPAEKTNEASESKEETTAQAQAKTVTYVLNTKTKKFHLPSCGSLPTTNRAYTDESRDEVIADGYVPCKRCNP